MEPLLRNERPTSMRSLLAALGLVLLTGACATEGDADPPGPDRSVTSADALCAAALRFDGHDYTGHGELRRHPETAGNLGAGTIPGCDDGNGASADQQVEVVALAALPPERAVLVGGQVFLADDQPFPEEIRPWFEEPTCDLAGSFELGGAWLSVMSPREVRFDGDIRPPYRIEVDVRTGPDAYAGTVLTIHATEGTEPTLGPDDVKSSLWEGGDVTATVRCDGDRFVATGLTSSPG